MEIRKADEGDIPAIVELLKVSLGDSRTPKSEALWRWKHIDNPFGPSPVLVAVDRDKLVAVRAFMRWNWRRGQEVLHSLRAVDTAVHPEHQGKGVFSKLTTALVEQCKADGYDFIFNTPNRKSRPGYFKLGWKALGRLPVALRLTLGVHNSSNELTLPWAALRENVFGYDWNPSVWRTDASIHYLYWRYRDNPNWVYYISRAGKGAIIWRPVSRMGVVEQRVLQCLGNPSLSDLPSSGFGLRLITSSGEECRGCIRLPVGPIVTLRNLNVSGNLPEFTSWRPALGDMEFF